MRAYSKSRIVSCLRDARSYLILGHYNPEGDAIGSCLALALGLRKIGKRNIHVVNRDGVPEVLKFLPGSKMVRQRLPSKTVDLCVIVDCNSLRRTGFDTIRAREFILIDHHLLPEKKDHTNPPLKASLVDTDASATGVLVYRILRAIGVEIDRDIATNLYTALVVDTGGFRYSNTTPESLKIASYLVEAGASPWEITRHVYESIPFKSMKLLGLSLSTLESRNKVAWIKTTKEMFRATGTTAEDSEDFVDFPRKVKDVEVAVFFRQDGERSYKISLRSKGGVNVEKIARRFGGGGHAPAAGCNVEGTFEEVKDKILEAVDDAIRDSGRR